MFSFTQYDAKDCTIIVDGVYITGLSEDMVEGNKNEDFVKMAVGAQGDVVSNRINNPLGTVKITIQTTSPQKKMLLDIAKTSRVVPVWVANKSIHERFGGSKAQIINYPDFKESAEAQDLEFEFAVGDYDVTAI